MVGKTSPKIGGNKMTTNVPTSEIIQGIWKPIIIEGNAYTATFQSTSFILWFPDRSKSIILEEEIRSSEEELNRLFQEFAIEDMELAEEGITEYNELLLLEDRE